MKRGRGRPRGEKYNDNPQLAKVADLLVAHKAASPRDAMLQVMETLDQLGGTTETVLRRWQVRWQKRGEEFLAAARRRAEPVESVRDYLTRWQLQQAAHRDLIFKQPDDLENNPILRMIHDIANGPEVQRIRERLDRVRLQAQQTIAENPGLKQFLEVISSPTKAMLEWEDSPTMKALREVASAPAMWTMREQENGFAMKIMSDFENGAFARMNRQMENSLSGQLARSLDPRWPLI